MNEFQFCYWLMGIFELGHVEKFSTIQLDLVKEHLNLVEERKYNFCNWLNGFLDAHEESDMNQLKTGKILEKLRLEFLQTIDPSYPKFLQARLSQAHNKETPNYLIKC